eukprot:11148475-Alexandrium_andersonii.AAC.1
MGMAKGWAEKATLAKRRPAAAAPSSSGIERSQVALLPMTHPRLSRSWVAKTRRRVSVLHARLVTCSTWGGSRSTNAMFRTTLPHS